MGQLASVIHYVLFAKLRLGLAVKDSLFMDDDRALMSEGFVVVSAKVKREMKEAWESCDALFAVICTLKRFGDPDNSTSWVDTHDGTRSIDLY